MLGWLWKAALLLSSALMSAPVSAAPVFTYGFSVDTCVAVAADPYAPPGSPCNTLTIGVLEASFISLTQDAVRLRGAHYYYLQSPFVPVLFINDGVVDMSLPRPGGLGHRSYLPPSCSGVCETDIGIAIGPGVTSLLSGYFKTDSWSDNLRMTGVAGVWSGYLVSDLFSHGGEFTGHWSLIQVVSEPGALHLTLVALGLLATLTARRRPFH